MQSTENLDIQSDQEGHKEHQGYALGYCLPRLMLTQINLFLKGSLTHKGKKKKGQSLSSRSTFGTNEVSF